MGILTIAFDDGYKDTFDNCSEYLASLDISATFAIPSECLGKTLEDRPVIDTTALSSLVKCGHEVASHTMKHQNLLDVLKNSGKATVHEEIINSKNSLAAILGSPIDSFVFPFITENRNSLLIEMALQHYRSVRITDETLSMNSPSLYNTRCFTGTAMTVNNSLEEMNSCINTAIDKNFWLIEVFHLVSNKNTKSAHRDAPYRFFTDITVFKEHIEHVISSGIPVLTQKKVVDSFIT